MPRVLIVDDHKIFRETLRLLIARQTDLVIAGEACDGCTAIRMAQELDVDVVLLDVSLPDVSGVEVARHVTSLPRHPKVVVLSAFDAHEFVTATAQAGASGYLLKSCCFEELVAAVKTVLGGGTYFSKSLRRAPVEPGLYARREPALSPAALTDREREVLQLIAEGYSTKEIGDRLDVSPKTVSTHRTHIMEKLGLTTVAALTRYAVREDLSAEGAPGLPDEPGAPVTPTAGEAPAVAGARAAKRSAKGAQRAGGGPKG